MVATLSSVETRAVALTPLSRGVGPVLLVPLDLGSQGRLVQAFKGIWEAEQFAVYRQNFSLYALKKGRPNP